MEPFSFSFSNGFVTGPNYSFDLKPIVNALNEAEKAFYRASPQMLISFVYENWNKTFNSQCILAGGQFNLGVTWDQQCLVASGTPNLLSAAGQGILGAVAAWGTAYLGVSIPPTGGSGGSSGGSSTGTGNPTGGSGAGAGNGGDTGTPSGSQDGFGLSSTMIWILAGVAAIFILKR